MGTSWKEIYKDYIFDHHGTEVFRTPNVDGGAVTSHIKDLWIIDDVVYKTHTWDNPKRKEYKVIILKDGDTFSDYKTKGFDTDYVRQNWKEKPIRRVKLWNGVNYG